MAILILTLICLWLGWVLLSFKFAVWISDGELWGAPVAIFLAFLPFALAAQVSA